MLKMGKMCHCGVTLQKWDVDGNRLWRHRRGEVQGSPAAARADLCFDADFANDLIYAGGTLVQDEDEGAVYRLSDIDSAPTIDWKSDRNGNTEAAPLATPSSGYHRIRIGDDGYVTRFASGGKLLRYNPSTGQITASATLAVDDAQLHRAGSGNTFVMARAGSGGSVKKYDTGLSVTHTLNTPAEPFGATEHNGGMFYSWSGFVFGCRLTDGNLATTHSGAFSVNKAVSDGTYVFAGGGSSFRRLSFSGSSINVDWTNSTTTLSGTGYANNADGSGTAGSKKGLLVADGTDLYCVMEKSGAVSKIQKRSIADGSITWEYDVGVSKAIGMRDLRVGGGIVVGIGKWFNGSGSTEPRNIVALDTDGDLVWDDMLNRESGGGLYELRVDDSGNVYASGYDA